MKKLTGISKSVTSAASNLTAMWAAVDKVKKEAFGEILHVRPSNSITVNEYAGKYSLSIEVARAQLERLKQTGKMNRVNALLPDARGHVKSTVVYVIPGKL